MQRRDSSHILATDIISLKEYDAIGLICTGGHSFLEPADRQPLQCVAWRLRAALYIGFISGTR
jgi:hypothetical protein